jgi:hypothetical protein
MTASRESSRTNVTLVCAIAAALEGALPFVETVVVKPARTEMFDVAAPSTPRTSTAPSVVPTVVEPEASTRTVNAVPDTEAVADGVVTAYRVDDW